MLLRPIFLVLPPLHFINNLGKKTNNAYPRHRHSKGPTFSPRATRIMQGYSLSTASTARIQSKVACVFFGVLLECPQKDCIQSFKSAILRRSLPDLQESRDACCSPLSRDEWCPAYVPRVWGCTMMKPTVRGGDPIGL